MHPDKKGNNGDGSAHEKSRVMIMAAIFRKSLCFATWYKVKLIHKDLDNDGWSNDSCKKNLFLIGGNVFRTRIIMTDEYFSGRKSYNDSKKIFSPANIKKLTNNSQNHNVDNIFANF